MDAGRTVFVAGPNALRSMVVVQIPRSYAATVGGLAIRPTMCPRASEKSANMVHEIDVVL